MGTLSTVGVVSDGSLSAGSANLYKESVADTIKNGLDIGSTTIPGGIISPGLFETGTIDDIKSAYPAWNAYYVDGILTNIALALDQIPDTGIGFPIIFDPTKPVAIILTELAEIFEPLTSILGLPLQEIILSDLSVFIEKKDEITEKLSGVVSAVKDSLPEDEILVAAESFLDTIKDAISETLTSAGKNVDVVVNKIEESKSSITQKIIQIAESLKDAAASLLPALPVPILDISFITPGVSIAPLFASLEVDGVDGIATKFIKIMTAFLKIPTEILEAISSLINNASNAVSEFISDLFSAINKIFDDITQAVKDMLAALLGFVWDKITEVLDINPAAVLELSSVASIVSFFAKSFVVAMLGFVLGSGLTTLSVAKLLQIV